MKCPNCSKAHAAHVVARSSRPLRLEIVVVRGGPRTYVWLGTAGDKRGAYFAGEATLRKVALAILSEVGREPKTRPKRKARGGEG